MNLSSQYWKDLHTEEVPSPSGTRGYLKKQAVKVYLFLGHSKISPT